MLYVQDLSSLLNFYFKKLEGITTLRSSSDRVVEIKPLIDKGYLVESSAATRLYDWTTGYSLTKEGERAIESAVEAFNDPRTTSP
jgi:hypothetical protein